MITDARAKAEYATRMMHVAADLAVAAPSDRQARILARYALIHADSAQRWIGAWHKELKGAPETAGIARGGQHGTAQVAPGVCQPEDRARQDRREASSCQQGACC